MMDVQLQLQIISYRDRWLKGELGPTAIADKVGTSRIYTQSILRRSKDPIPEKLTTELIARRDDIEKNRFNIREFTRLGASATAIYVEMLRLGIRFPESYKPNKELNVLSFTKAYQANLISVKDIATLSGTSPNYARMVLAKAGHLPYSGFFKSHRIDLPEVEPEPEITFPESKEPKKPKKFVLGIQV